MTDGRVNGQIFRGMINHLMVDIVVRGKFPVYFDATHQLAYAYI